MSKKQIITLVSAIILLSTFILLNLFYQKDKDYGLSTNANNDKTVNEAAIQFKLSCEEYGLWRGGENNDCEIAGNVYSNGSWARLADMEASCLEYKGEFYGGPKFMCKIDGEFYYNQDWVRVSVAPNMGVLCEADGGTWIDEYRECEGLGINWCIQTEMAFEEIKGLSFNECASACRHDSVGDICTQACVPVCSLNI